MNSNTGTLVRRQNSFGRDLGDPGGQGPGPGLCSSQNQTPTSFRTLPRINKTCEVLDNHSSDSFINCISYIQGSVNPSPSAFVPVPPGSRNGVVGFCPEVLRPTPPLQPPLRAVPKLSPCSANISSGLWFGLVCMVYTSSCSVVPTSLVLLVLG